MTSQAALQAYADRKLAAASGVASKIEVEHAFLPELLINSSVRFDYTQDDVNLSMLCTVQNTKIPLDPTALCRSTLREVVS